MTVVFLVKSSRGIAVCRSCSFSSRRIEYYFYFKIKYNSNLILNYAVKLNLIKRKMLMKKAIIICVVLFAMADVNAQLSNQQHEKLQLSTDQQEQFNLYVDELILRAENDDAHAQYSLAELYLHQDNPDRDLYKAVYWFEKSAENGNSDAALELGQFYSAGSAGLEKNCELSVYWSTKATKSYNSSVAWNNIAWVLATCPDDSFIDAKRALKIMQDHGNESNQLSGVMDTLAAVYAQLGDFTKAVSLQETAILLIKNENNIQRINSMKSRLEKYKNKEAWTGFAHSNPDKFIE